MISSIFTIKKFFLLSLAAFLLAFLFIFLHFYLYFDLIRFDKDTSLQELVEITLLIASSLICNEIIFKITKNFVFKILSFILLFAAFDDLFGVHEIFGALFSYMMLTKSIAESLGSEPQDIGEMFYFGSQGIFFSWLLIKDYRSIKFGMAPILISSLFIFTGGVLIDFFRSFSFFPEIKNIGFFEDFIEYLGINLIFLSTFYYTVGVFKKVKNVPTSK